jgi:chromosome segregation ATPase
MSGSKNGGSGEYEAAPTTLEQVIASLQERLKEPDDPPSSEGEGWKYAATNLRRVQEDLLSIAQSVSDAVKGNTSIAKDVRRLLEVSLPVVLERWPIVEGQVRSIVTKLEVLDKMLDQVDEAQAGINGTIHAMRRELHDAKVDIAAVKEHASLLPAIKSLLIDIIDRLPEPPPPKTA